MCESQCHPSKVKCWNRNYIRCQRRPLKPERLWLLFPFGPLQGQLIVHCGLESTPGCPGESRVLSSGREDLRSDLCLAVFGYEAPRFPLCPLLGERVNTEGIGQSMGMPRIGAKVTPQHGLSDSLSRNLWWTKGRESEYVCNSSESTPLRWGPVRPNVSLRPNHVDRDKSHKIFQAEVEQQEPTYCPRMGTFAIIPQKLQSAQTQEPAQSKDVSFTLIWSQINYHKQT